jgi:hypothetical protein
VYLSVSSVGKTSFCASTERNTNTFIFGTAKLISADQRQFRFNKGHFTWDHEKNSNSSFLFKEIIRLQKGSDKDKNYWAVLQTRTVQIQ